MFHHGKRPQKLPRSIRLKRPAGGTKLLPSPHHQRCMAEMRSRDDEDRTG